MESIDFLDLIRPNAEMAGIRSEIERVALGQISRGNFQKRGNRIETEIDIDGVRRKVIIEDTLSCKEFCERVYITSPQEPSLDYLYTKTGNYLGKSLVEMLEEYKSENLVKGEALKGETWIKFYSLNKISDSMRDLYHASWINYEEQLMSGNVIFDENRLNGIWAMPVDMVPKCVNKECFERYGDHVFIVQPVEDGKYLLDGKEIIGDKYEVIDKLDLSEIDDMGELCNRLLEIQKDENQKYWEEQYAELKEEKIRCANDLQKLYTSLVMVKNQRLFFIVMGIILGIMIGRLF